jgi:3'(2'), 5'-bisphosphate nucleotidase
MVRRSIGAAIYAMCGGDEGARGRAAKRANRAIYDGLRKLVPEIPIISSVSPKISDAERAKCNHLWLVDPLGGVDPVLDGESEIAVSVALVEDGRAIYGVVYAPFTDTVYYGRLGQGAYKAERGGVPERIEIPGSDSAPSAAALDRTERVVRGLHNEHRTPPRSPALAVCVRLADGSGAYSRPEPAMEWETAAAHAIATAAGRRLCDPASGEELRYNKKDLVARPFVVE